MPAESLARPTGSPRGLTHALTSFVGRTDAIAKVARLLAEYRLVTVTGPGGVGKTRLAAEVLEGVSDRFADGVWVVELAAVQNPELVPATVATVLGVQQAAGVPAAVDALAARLSRQQLLLVLDNCEHVLDAVSGLCANVLVSADDVRILATSREPMGIPEEARCRLPPLGLPENGGPDQPAQAEAVTLFVERARQLDPDLNLEGESRPVVERLVRRLDGMPLAIELAAARVEALGLVQLLDQLDDRFRLLVSANPASAARQRSLEATVEWSYRLLGEPQQRLFRFLAVFPGPFTLEAAEAVAGPDARLGVLRLVDCSLVVPPLTGADGRSRYAMLETLRGFGIGRLRGGGEEHSASSALAAHALDVAERAAARLAMRDQELAAACWLDAEDATMHQALSWALDHDPPVALRLALALAPWWQLRGRWVEGYALLERAAARTGPGVDNWYSANVWLGQLSLGATNSSVMLAHFSRVVDALRDDPVSADLVDGLAGRSRVLYSMGRLPESAVDARAVVELARQIGYAAGEAAGLRQLGVLAIYEDRRDEAVEWARQVRRTDAGRIPGWRARHAWSLLPWALVTSGHLDGTQEVCDEVLAQARAAGDLSVQADMLYLMAALARQAGRLADAGGYLQAAAELAARSGYTFRLIDILDEAGLECAAAGRHAEAVTLWSAGAVQIAAAGLADTPRDQSNREPALREARRVLGVQQVAAAQERGAAMTLAAAVEFAVLTTGEEVPARPTPLGSLSARERELIALVARGQTDAQIAGQLFISVSTVRTYLDRVRDKSGCRRRADLTRLALQEGII